MKCYIGGELDSNIIARNKQPGFEEYDCTKEEISSFSKIVVGDMITIQKKIDAILFRNQLKLPYDNGKTNNADV